MAGGPYICPMTSAQTAGGRLSVCATPIGNMEDITLRVLSTLAEADVVACEDTRHTRILFSRHGIATPLVSLHEHNEGRRARELTKRPEEVRRGSAAALARRYAAPGRHRAAARGEITLVIGAAERSTADRERAVRTLGELVAAGARPRAAASALAGLTGVGAN